MGNCQKCQHLSKTLKVELKAPGIETGDVTLVGCELHIIMAKDKIEKFDISMMKIAETYSMKIHDLEHKLEAKQKDYDNVLFRLRHQQNKGFTMQ